MQELIERLQRNIEQMPNEINTYTQGYKAGLNFVIECATTSLEKEKEQMINAWIATDNELQRLAAEEYYNQTYNQNK